jgi:thymidine kinase
MYLEVGNRGTGKTTRLVENVITFLKNNIDKSALIITKSEYRRKDIQKEVYNKCGRPCEHRVITSYKMITPKVTIKQFVDELWSIEPKNLIFDKNAYYTGKPGPFFNSVIDEILNYHSKINCLKPSTNLKRHGFTGNN